MGKKKKSESLGRALIKDRFSSRGKRNDSMLHTSELNDGYDWGRLNLQSVTEESSFDEFLRIAELAGTEFQAEKLNVEFVRSDKQLGVLTASQRQDFEKLKQDKSQLLRIPRRPSWDSETTAEELQAKERESFLEWRRGLAALQEQDGLVLTPYEKNLDFWRQLWRVVERSDVVVQIVDARNPLLFRCEDLEKYSTQVCSDKMNFLLLNKSDYLTAEQRRYWARYFDSIGLRCAFYSALTDLQKIQEEINEGKDEEESITKEKTEINDEVLSNEQPSNVRDDETERLSKQTNPASNQTNSSSELTKSEFDQTNTKSEQTISTSELPNDDKEISEVNNETFKETLCGDNNKTEQSTPSEQFISGTEEVDADEKSSEGTTGEDKMAKGLNSSKLLGREELIKLFESLLPVGSRSVTPGQVTVGLVGYPNVGKSSTINSLMGAKKVSVSATPGKTKHFQTLYLEDSTVMLCDCPGLVFPSMVATKADMLLSGILPIDQMRDYTDAIATLRSLIPDSLLQQVYAIMIPPQPPGAHQHSPHTLLSSYAYSRGFMTANGVPDMSRAARLVLKDFVNGKLLYCHAPPDVEQSIYHVFPEVTRKLVKLTPIAARAIADKKVTNMTDLDKNFFIKASLGAHSKGSSVAGTLLHPSTSASPSAASSCSNLAAGSSSSNPQTASKPWKDHSHKRNKKEKLRRLYRHLDE